MGRHHALKKMGLTANQDAHFGSHLLDGIEQQNQQRIMRCLHQAAMNSESFRANCSGSSATDSISSQSRVSSERSASVRCPAAKPAFSTSRIERT